MAYPREEMTPDEKLRYSLSVVFGIDADSINDTTSAETVENWDSLRHLNLVLVLEEQFGISFKEEDTVVTSYAGLKDVLKGYGFDFTGQVG